MNMLTEIIQQPELWSLSDLYICYDFSPDRVDTQASVPPGTVDLMLQNVPILREHAEKVLNIMSQQIRDNQRFNFSNIAVQLIEERGGQKEERRSSYFIANEY